jgi:hypothetical protein
MDVRDLLLAQHSSAHEMLDGVIAGIDYSLLHRVLEGATNNSIASTYAHIYLSEDHFVNVTLCGEATIYDRGGWRDHTGVAPQNGGRQDADWAKHVRLNFERFRPYASEVRKSTAAFLQSATEAELGREVGTQVKMPAAIFFARVNLYHIAGHTGEIAALKGVAGLKGLPF